MNYDNSEKKIRRLFKELRTEDENNVPSFAKVYREAEIRSGLKPKFGILPRLAAAVILILLGGSVLVIYHESSIWRPPQEIPIAGWQSPTASLLRIPGTLLSGTERITTSSREPRRMTVAGSHWSSPTLALMRSSGENFLKRSLNLGVPPSWSGAPTSYN